MPKRSDRKPPNTQRPPQPNTLAIWGTLIGYGLQVAATTAYNLFEWFYKDAPPTQNTIAAIAHTEAPTATAAPAPAPAVDTQSAQRKSKSKRAPTQSNASSQSLQSELAISPSPEILTPKTAQDLQILLSLALPTEEHIASIADAVQRKYYQRHLASLKECLKSLQNKALSDERYTHYKTQITAISSPLSIEEKIIGVGNLYNQLMAELNIKNFEKKLFCMLPYIIEGAKVSGQTVSDILTKLQAIFSEMGVNNIQMFLSGTSIIAPEIAQDIDITIHANTPADASALEAAFLSEPLPGKLRAGGFNCEQLISAEDRKTHLLSIEGTRVDLTFCNTSIKKGLSSRLTNISASYLTADGHWLATTQIAAFFAESKIVMCSEPDLSAHPRTPLHLSNVCRKSKIKGWDASDIEQWLSAHIDDRPTLATPPRSSRSNVTTPISPIAAAFHAAVIARRVEFGKNTAAAYNSGSSPPK